MTSIRKGFKSTSAAAILGLSTIVGVTAAPALAPIAVAQTAPQPSNINPAEKGSIVIHKLSGSEGDTRDNGNPNPNAAGEPLPGVTFTAQQITDVDLTTNEGFAQASELTAATAATRPLGELRTQETGPDGIATFSDLPVGVYLVKETKAPEGYAPGAPFLVYIPMTNPESRTGWNYNVNVYPKNSQLNAKKEIVDADQNVADSVTFKISTDVPTPAGDGNISKYVVTDQLQANRVSTTPERVTASLSVGEQQLVSGDYNVEVSPEQLVTVTFTDQGLAKLTQAKKANPSVQVVTNIEATVATVGQTDGHLENQATVISNRGSGSGDVEKPTNKVEAFWGKLKIQKQGDESAPLNGAKFNVYRCTDADNLEDQKIEIDGVSEWETSGDGSVTIDGLHVTDFENNAQVQDPGKYCLVETQAPEGYELLTKPVEVNFTRADLAVDTDGTDTVTQLATVTNVKSNGPKLPLTGGAGIGLLALLGAALVGAGAWWAKRNSSKA